jgi:nicotinamidase-related amidase
MRILKDDTAGLIIDIQERLFPFIHEHDRIARNTAILIQGFKTLDLPIVVTQQYTKGLGGTVAPVLEALGTENYLEKVAFSCCDDNGFMQELSRHGRKNVVIAGIEAHVCVLQTTIDLISNGYQPIVVEDCVSSRSPNDKTVAIARMRAEGAIITTYESILFELLRFSGTSEFKSISKLVK